jgi:putative chitinase
MPWKCGAKNCQTHSSPEHACPGWILGPIRGSVGLGGANQKDDVQIVQGGLNRVASDRGGPWPRLVTDGAVSYVVFDAIKRFQRTFFGNTNPDGRVDPYGNTYRELSRDIHLNILQLA